MSEFDQMMTETLNPQHLTGKSNPWPIPISAGVIYWIEKSEKMFRVHCYPSENLKVDLDQTKSKDFENFKQERNLEGLDIFWKYFQTPYLEIAQVVCDQVNRYRFAYEEYNWLSVSDPDLCWWMESISDLSFNIYFSFPGHHQDKAIQKIGPLADKNVALRFFQNAFKKYSSFAYLEEFSIDQYKMTFSLSEKAHEELSSLPQFKEAKDLYFFIKTLFSQGRLALEMDFFSSIKDDGLHFFFNEIAYCRSFWIKLQQEI